MSDSMLWAKRGPIPSRPAMIWKDGKRVQAEDDFGRPLFERVPQSGKVGMVRVVADIETLKPQSQPRFITFLHMDGNICNDPITGAAASTPTTDKSFEIGVRQKARYHGWIQVGCCPIDAAMRRDITGLQLMAPSNREALKTKSSCPPDQVGSRKPPCRHFEAEERARKELRAEQDRKATRKSAADRQAEAFEKLADRIGDKLEPDEKPAPAPKGPGK